MLRTQSVVTIATPARYAMRLAKHFEHRVAVDREEGRFSVHFPDCECTLVPQEAVLEMTLVAASAELLARVQGVVAKHLIQVAPEEKLTIEWSAPASV